MSTYVIFPVRDGVVTDGRAHAAGYSDESQDWAREAVLAANPDATGTARAWVGDEVFPGDIAGEHLDMEVPRAEPATLPAVAGTKDALDERILRHLAFAAEAGIPAVTREARRLAWRAGWVAHHRNGCATTWRTHTGAHVALDNRAGGFRAHWS